jgi:hypothetical protein
LVLLHALVHPLVLVLSSHLAWLQGRSLPLLLSRQHCLLVLLHTLLGIARLLMRLLLMLDLDLLLLLLLG